MKSDILLYYVLALAQQDLLLNFTGLYSIHTAQQTVECFIIREASSPYFMIFAVYHIRNFIVKEIILKRKPQKNLLWKRVTIASSKILGLSYYIIHYIIHAY